MIYGNVEQNGHNWDKRPAVCALGTEGQKGRSGYSGGNKEEEIFTGSEGDTDVPHRPPAETIFLPDEELFTSCRSGSYITAAPTYQADATVVTDLPSQSPERLR